MSVDRLNPYESPSQIEASESWWARLRRWIVWAIWKQPKKFELGHAILFEGIAYFINPKVPFLAEHTELRSLLRHRQLTVRIIRSYADCQVEFIREADVGTIVIDDIDSE